MVKIDKKNKGLTLMELVVALGLWLILSVGVFFLWQHTAGSAGNMLQRQSAFERARGAMDLLISGIELSYRVELSTNGQGLLDSMIARGYNHENRMNDFIFEFRADNTLRLSSNEVANNIAAVYVTYTQNRMDITIHTACEEAIVLHGSVDVRYKSVVRR